MSWGEFLNKNNKYPNGITWNQLKNGFNYFEGVDGILVGEMVMPSENFPYAQWVKDLFPLRVEEICIFKCDGKNDLKIRFRYNEQVTLMKELNFYSYKDGKYHCNFQSRNSKINQILEENEIDIQS
jgi:hypothetical protein